MRIAQSPYRAEIVPHASAVNSLWHCIIQREGSTEVVARLEAARKEDARCIALLELARLQPDSPESNSV
jgi:hypothetical protein